MTLSTRRIGIGLGAIALVVALHTLVAMHAPRGHRPTLGWPAGTEIDYRLQFAARSEVALSADAGSNLSGEVDLDGDLTLRSHGRDSGRWLLELELGALRRHRIEVIGHAVGDDAARALAGHRAYLRVADDGAIERIYVEPDAPPLFKQLIETVAPLLQVTVPDGASDSWSVSEPGPSGRARVTYHADGQTMTRERERYERLSALPTPPHGSRTTLDARSRITLTASGQVAELHDRERLSLRLGERTLLDARATLDLVEVARHTSASSAPVALDRLEAREPGVVAPDGASKQALLVQQAAGLDRQQLLDGVPRFAELDGEGGRAWFVRAAALLSLDATLPATLAERFGAKDATPATRIFIADLLAAAGTQPAQAALRSAFAMLHGDEQAEVAIVQKFGRLRHPDDASGELVRATFRGAGGNLRFAAAYTLGSIAAHSDDSVARTIGHELTGELEAARSNAERRELLAALGNAGLAETTPAIARFAADADAQVRARATQALRRIDNEESRRLLVTLAHDADVQVSTQALAVLGARPLDGSALTQIVDGAHPGATRATDAALLAFASSHLDGGAAVRALLESLATTARDRELQSRARVLLAQLNG